MADTKLPDLEGLPIPASGDFIYIVDSSDLTDSTAGTSKSATLGAVSTGIVATSLDITGLTASELIRLNSGGTALESAGLAVAMVVTLTGIQTLTQKTLTSPVLTTPQINDTSKDHQYVFAVSELSADRTVTLPLLTGNDEFVFKDFDE